MPGVPLFEALEQLHRLDPSFTPEIRKRLAPVKDRFFEPPLRAAAHERKDGLHTPPPWIAEPDLRKVAIELAELALERGIDVNIVCDQDGSTFLHLCALIRDDSIALEAVQWLLVHGADPNLKRDDGETPLELAVKLGRAEVAAVMRVHGGTESE